MVPCESSGSTGSTKVSKRFHLNGHTIGFRLQSQKLELHYMSSQQGAGRDGAVVRPLISHPCGLGSILALGIMWVEFVVSSSPFSESFIPGTLVFPPSLKTFISKFQFNQEFEGHKFVSHTQLLSVALTKQS